MNTLRDCLLITGPNANPKDAADISLSLGYSDINVIVADLSKGKPFRVDAEATIEGIIILGQPNVSVKGIRDIYPEATTVVVGLPPRQRVEDVKYVQNFYQATTAVQRGMAELDASMYNMLFLDGLVLADEIEAIPEDRRQAATAA